MNKNHLPKGSPASAGGQFTHGARQESDRVIKRRTWPYRSTTANMVVHSCGGYFNTREFFQLRRGMVGYEHIQCPHCGEDCRLDSDEYLVAPGATSHHLVEPDGVLGATWWHATEHGNWSELVENGTIEEVHGGTMAAAMDRMKMLGCKRFWLFEFRLDPHTSVRDFVPDGLESEARPGEVQPYVNAVEAPGSVSIYAEGSTVHVVSRRRVGVSDDSRPTFASY